MKKVDMAPYLLIAPALLLMLLIVAYPIGNSIYMSFCNYQLFKLSDTRFIGLANYINVLKDPVFYTSLVNTLIWVICGVFFQFFFGMILALVLNQKFRFRGLVRSIVLIPWVTPGVLIGLMWRWMYDGNYGVVNDILSRLHLIKGFVPWLAQPNTVLGAIIVAIVWQGIPFFAIMILAGLQGIPKELYEATDVDGATSWQKFIHVTLPMLRNTIFVTTLLRIIWVANSIDIIYSMSGGGPGYSSNTLAVFAFVKARGSLDFGYGSTISIFLTLMLLVVMFVYIKELKKQGDKL